MLIHPELLSFDLTDYKFFCFHGEPVYCQVIKDRTSCETVDFYDMDWKHQEFTGLSLPHNPHSINPIPKPWSFSIMKESAKKLARGIPFVRVDFYEVNRRVYFGEMTFYPACGFGEFSPNNWNYRLGKMLNLSEQQISVGRRKRE